VDEGSGDSEVTLRTTKPNRCKHCRERMPEDKPRHVLHEECITPFLDALAVKKEAERKKKELIAERLERAEDRKRREKLKSNGERKADAQAAINRWIVHVRDAGEPCISCGRHHQGMYHAGHYRSRGSAPHLALDPRNLHKQCAPCNLHLHGNLIAYRVGLVRKYGPEFVAELETDQEPRHYTGADYDAIKAEYRLKTKHLKKEKA
jgi:hypothetical protein